MFENKARPDDKKPEDLRLIMGSYDWKEAMKYAAFTFSDIQKVILSEEGQPDGEDWKLVVKLKRKNGFGVLRAWCDYSGWGCQEGGESRILKTKKEALALVDKKAEG